MRDDNDENLEFKTVNTIISSLFHDDVEHRILSPLSYLREFDNHWMLEIDLPLVNKNDIKVTLDTNVITVEAKLKEEYLEEKLGRVTKFEYFKKSIALPGKIDSKKIITKFQKGRLEIKVLKQTVGHSIKID